MNISTQTQQTTLSTEIAELTGKHHKNVIRDIEVVIEQLKKNGSNLSFLIESTTYIGENGNPYKCYALDYEATMLILSGYDVLLRAKVIKRWQELEQAKKPLSTFELIAQMAQASADLEKRQATLENEVALLKAKAITSPVDYTTIMGFASMRNRRIDVSKARALGKRASVYSRQYDYPIHKAHSEIFGEANTYPTDVLTWLFKDE